MEGVNQLVGHHCFEPGSGLRAQVFAQKRSYLYFGPEIKRRHKAVLAVIIRVQYNGKVSQLTTYKRLNIIIFQLKNGKRFASERIVPGWINNPELPGLELSPVLAGCSVLCTVKLSTGVTKKQSR